MELVTIPMLNALHAARFVGSVGLKRTVGGWVEETKPDTHYGFAAVSALVLLGHLEQSTELSGPGWDIRVFITASGLAALEEQVSVGWRA